MPNKVCAACGMEKDDDLVLKRFDGSEVTFIIVKGARKSRKQSKIMQKQLKEENKSDVRGKEADTSGDNLE